MIKEISLAIPDEPYVDSFTNSNVLKLTYEGSRYILISVDKDSGGIIGIAGQGETADDDIFAMMIPPENCENVVLSTNDFPLEVAFITNDYSYEPVDDFVETLSTGEEHRIQYPQQGILDFYFDRSQVKYNFDTKKIEGLDTYKGPPVTDESMLETVKLQLTMHQEQLAELKTDGAPDVIINRYEKMIAWLTNYSTKYAGIPAYKVPYPTLESFDSE